MIKIIKQREPETIIDRYIEFTYKDDPEAGFVFPALPNGEPDFANMPDAAQTNYMNCLNDDRLEGPEFKVEKREYMNPAVGECICGREVILDAGYGDAIMCDCGKWYNLYGQELLPPEYWEDDNEY